MVAGAGPDGPTTGATGGADAPPGPGAAVGGGPLGDGGVGGEPGDDGMLGGEETGMLGGDPGAPNPEGTLGACWMIVCSLLGGAAGELSGTVAFGSEPGPPEDGDDPAGSFSSSVLRAPPATGDEVPPVGIDGGTDGTDPSVVAAASAASAFSAIWSASDGGPEAAPGPGSVAAGSG